MSTVTSGIWRREGGIWKRPGRPSVVPSGYDDGFLLRTTMPVATNSGVIAGVPRLPYTGPTIIDGSTDPLNPLRIENRDISQLLTIRSGYVDFFNCYLTGGPGSGNTGLVDCRPDRRFMVGEVQHHGHVNFDFCTFDPAVRSYWLNAVIGHHFTARRCLGRGLVDFFGVYNTWYPEAMVTLEGNFLDWLVRYDVDADHTDGTHNDGVQCQGGFGIWIIGNNFNGYTRYADGTSIPASPWHRSAQGILVQQNVGFDTNGLWVPGGGGTHAAINPVIEDNWLNGWMHPMSIKTRAGGNHTNYNAVVRRNKLTNSDQRRYGSTIYYDGIAGRPYIIRTDLGVTINGLGTAAYPSGYPADGEPYRDVHDNIYADVPDVHALLRGTKLPIRRDNFYGG